MYNHGIRVTEDVATSLSTVTGDNIHVIVGTAPVNMCADPQASVNNAILVNNFKEAKEKFGYSEDFANYTISEAMFTYFKLIGVSPVVFINVLDPEKHKSNITDISCSVVNNQTTLKESGILLDTVVIKADSETLNVNTDYILNFTDEGYLSITVLKAGVSTITISASKLDPSAVTPTDIIGGCDIETGEETGLELLRTVYPKFGKVVALLAVPGYSSDKTVSAVMQAKTTDINSLFSCQCVIDIDTKTTVKYTDVSTKKDKDGIYSANAIPLWPKIKVDNRILNYSSVYGAAVAKSDIDNDNIPSQSPSNKIINISGAVVDNGDEINLDINQANELNEYGVVTVLNLNGWRTWGNNTAAYPTVTDYKDRWINNRRFFSWMENRFIVQYFECVDSANSVRSIESLIDKENQFCNSLVAAGKCAGAYIEFLAEDNPAKQLADGHVVVRQHIANYAPTEDILNIVSFDTSLLQSALQIALGGEMND